MNLKKLLKSKRRAAAIPLAIIAVMILLALGAGLQSLGLNARIYSARTASDIAARCAADAGLTMAVFEMNKELQASSLVAFTSLEATDVQLPNCDQVFSYKVTGDVANGYTVTSTGRSGGAERTVRAKLRFKGVFDHAIFADGALVLKSGTLVDTYNSADPLDTSKSASIRTHSTLDSSIVLNSGVTVLGKILVGIGGDPDTVIKDLGATTGNRYCAAPEQLPEVAPPSTLADKNTSISAKGETVKITPAESGTYTSISLKQAADLGVLEITGGDVVLHVTGDIELGQGCEILVDDGSTLTLYVDGDVHCREGSGMGAKSNRENSNQLELYGTAKESQSFDIKAKSDWSGVVYAPNADVVLFAGGDAYGSIMANNFEFKAGGHYHYDEALRKVSVEDEGVRLVIDRWDED